MDESYQAKSSENIKGATYTDGHRMVPKDFWGNGIARGDWGLGVGVNSETNDDRT